MHKRWIIFYIKNINKSFSRKRTLRKAARTHILRNSDIIISNICSPICEVTAPRAVTASNPQRHMLNVRVVFLEASTSGRLFPSRVQASRSNGKVRPTINCELLWMGVMVAWSWLGKVAKQVSCVRTLWSCFVWITLKTWWMTSRIITSAVLVFQ